MRLLLLLLLAAAAAAFFHFLREKKVYEINILCVCVLCPFQLFNKFTDFHKIWYEHYAVGGQPSIMLVIYYNKHI
jgi:hypothetical protein